MEVVLYAACGVLVGSAAWVALGERVSSPFAYASHLEVVFHAAVRWLEALGTTRVVAGLMGWHAFSSVAEDLRVRAERGLRRPVGIHVAAASLLVAVLGLGLLAGVLTSSIVAVPAVHAMCLLGLQANHDVRDRQRMRTMSQEMPGILRTMASALGSGHTLVQAIEYIGVNEQGPAAEYFVRTSLRLRCGESVEQALGYLASELEAPGVGLMVTALTISQRTGSPLRDLLQRSAVLVERQGEFERLLRVRTAQVRLSVRIVCGLPPLMVGLLSLVSPDFREGVFTGAGMTCLALATAMDVAALLIIRSIMGRVL